MPWKHPNTVCRYGGCPFIADDEGMCAMHREMQNHLRKMTPVLPGRADLPGERKTRARLSLLAGELDRAVCD